MARRAKRRSHQPARAGLQVLAKTAPVGSVVEIPRAKTFAPQIPHHKPGSSLYSYLALTAATILCLLPFSGRAFHVDDTLFVWAAKQIAIRPLDPYGFRLTWDNTQVAMAEVTQNPPLASYYAALIGRTAGWSERAMHLGFLLPTLALVLGTYRLAQRFTRSPLLAALATLLTPGLLVSASSVMCDTMMLAIWVWAVIFWVEGLQRAKPLFLTASGFLVAAAALTKYFGAALIPLLLTYAIVKERKLGKWALYLLIPVAILCGYQLWTADLYGHGLLLGAAAFAQSQRSYANMSVVAMALVGLSFAGGCALPSLVSAPFIWSRMRVLAGVVLSAIAATALALGWVNLGLQVGAAPILAARREHWLLIAIQLTLCIAGGISLLALVITQYWRDKKADSLLLTLWVLGTFGFAAFVNWSVNARSVLPLIPALGILLARRFDKIDGRSLGPMPVKAACVLLISGLVSLWVARADAELANSARQAALQIHERTQGQGGDLWFEGHWGFQYYMESLGAHPLDLENPRVKAGDFVAIPENNIQLRDIAPQFIGASQTLTLPLHTWASTICTTLGAGFYASNWGPLPYVFGPIPEERYQIIRLLAGPGGPPRPTDMAKRKRKGKARTPPPKPDPPLLRAAPIAVVVLAFLVFGYRLFELIDDYAVNIFFSDQWDFDDATLFQHHSLWQMFTWQHGPHRQGAGALLGWAVEPLFRWNSRTESFLVAGIIAVTALCVVLLKKKLYGRVSYSDAIIPLIFFCPLQYETLFITANLAHGPLPVLLLVLYCLAWICEDVLVRYGLLLAINFLTIYTGFGLLLGILTPVLLVVDYWVNLRTMPKGKVYLVTALLLALASFASFFIGYKNQPAADCFSFQLQNPVDYAWYAALMFAPFFGVQGIGALPTVVGVVAIIALMAFLTMSIIGLFRAQAKPRQRYLVIAILTAYCLLFCAATAYGRLCLGIGLAQSSRYVIYLELGLLGIYFYLLDISHRITRNMLVLVFGLSLLGTIASSERVRGQMAMFSQVKQGWKNCYLALGDVERCNQYARVYPWEPETTHLKEKLEFLRRTRQNLFADSN
ncbi:MAG TPA: glycosyltransferase family 39 protein [Terriglobales bacterium]|nr:glycosyltransferase family 39 protein [Terriglobales bacterium]